MSTWSKDCEEVWGVRIQDLSQLQMGYRQQLRMQFAPPPPMPPLPTARFHGSGIPPGSISPISRTGSDTSSSLAVQPPSYIPQGRLSHDALFLTLPSSSHQEIRVQVVREKQGRTIVNDASIDPALQAVSNARLQATSQLPVPVPPPSSLPSLPSLKSSGLLEWPRPGSTDAMVVSPNAQPGGMWQPPTQHLASSRQAPRDSTRSFGVQSTTDGPRPPAPSASSGMPVGLQWLAHESSAPRPS